MADTKITALTAITTVDPAVDVLPIVDVSDTTMAASGTTKKITSNQILGAGGTATLASATITGDLTVDTSTLKVDSALNKVGVGVATLTGLQTFNVAGDVGITSDLVLKNSGGTVQGYIFGSSGLNYRVIAGQPHVWQEGGSDLMRLNSTGLGVGGSPAAKVHVVGGAAQNPLILDSTGYNHCVLKVSGTNRGQFYADATNCFAVVNSAGSATTFVVTDTGNVGIGVTPSAWVNFKALQVQYACFASNQFGAGNIQTFIGSNTFYDGSGYKYIVSDAAARYALNDNVHAWYTAPSGTAGNAITFTQSMTLDASGNLLVGTTSASTTSGSGFKVTQPVAGHFDASIVTSANSSTYSCWDIYSTGGTAGYRFYVTSTGTINAVNTTISAISDARLKENVQDIDVGLGAILALKPRKFDWKAGKGKDIKGDRGFIAQEFEQVFPQLVDEWKDAAPEGETPYKSVRQDLIPVLVKAIQELTARVQTLETR